MQTDALRTNSKNFTQSMFALSLRTKLLLLLLCCLAAALISQVMVMTSYVARDKSAYLYDYLMAQVRAVSSAASLSPGNWKKEDLRISEYGQIRLVLVDNAGTVSFSTEEGTAALFSHADAQSMLKELPTQSFKSGVRTVTLDGSPYVMSYDRIRNWDGYAVGLMDEELVSSASQGLLLYSTALGATLFLLAGGAGLLLSRQITRRISMLAHASESVGEGNFNLDLDHKRFGSDEIGKLAFSFSLMAAKIKELVSRTAETARMETELKTARLVQERFVPKDALKGGGVTLAAFYQPASECSGDWWTAKLYNNKELFFMVGDVTGHGAAAALITAAAFGAIESSDPRGASGEELLIYLSKILNTAIFKAGRQESSMSAILGVYSSVERRLILINASHRPPLVAAHKTGGTEVKPLILKKSSALGVEANPEFIAETPDIPADATLVLYTDGVVETPGAAGDVMGSKGLVNMLAGVFNANPNPSDVVASRQKLVSVLEDHFGEQLAAPEDDITMLLARFS